MKPEDPFEDGLPHSVNYGKEEGARSTLAV